MYEMCPMFKMMGIDYKALVANSFSVSEGELEFEENAYIINFCTETFDYYDGSDLKRSFAFNEIPVTSKDFPAESGSDSSD